MLRVICLYGWSFTFFVTIYAQSNTFPLDDDVLTIDGIMKAYYEVVSGPAGEPRQVERDKSLHHPDALITITGKNEQNQSFANTMTIEEFHENTAPYDQGFFEWETDREVERFGNIAHVWSTYEWSNAENGPVGGRGINSIQLYHDGTRWWILSWMYDSERADNKIPLPYSIKSAGASIPEWFTKDLANHIGVWVTDNNQYVSSEEPYDRYFMQWTWGIGNTYIKGRLWGSQGDAVSDDFWEYIYYWDPVQQEAKLYQIGVAGIVGRGAIKMTEANATETYQKFFSPEMPGWKVKHEEKIVQDTMYSTSFNLTKEVEVIDRTYRWTKL